MFSRLNCWFWKKKNKDQSNQKVYRKENPEVVYTSPELRAVYNDFRKMNESNHHMYRRTSESLSRDPAYLDRLFGLEKGRKIRSYPVSPVRRSQEDKGYLSDHRHQRTVESPYRHGTPVVYVTDVPQTASHFKPKPPESKEPFPYEIPANSVPRRSSLFYGVKYDGNVTDFSESPRYRAEKPIEDSTPSTSKENHFIPQVERSQEENHNNTPVSGEKHVTIVPSSVNENFYMDETNPGPESPRRTTIVRFRPSSGSHSPSEHVKYMCLRPSQVEHPPMVRGKLVHDIPMKPSKHALVFKTGDGKILKPVEKNKIRTSLMSDRDSHLRRMSVGRKTDKDNVVSLESEEEEMVCAVPVMQAKRSSFSRTKRSSIVKEDGVYMNKTHPFPLNEDAQAPLVYTVPTVPTRGRTRSVLQQSVKSLSSKQPSDHPAVYRKNIRYSMDTDVFSSDSRRKSSGRNQPSYVNMEKGQTMLVSEVLNPITSLFISDLKDPVPKDPTTRPKENNNWVKYKSSKQPQPVKQPPKVPLMVYREPVHKSRIVPVLRRGSRSYSRRRTDSSSSEESIEVFRKKSRRSAQRKPYQQHAVYVTQMPETTLPTETGKNPPFKKKGKPVEVATRYSASKDFCGLNCETPEMINSPRHHTVKMVSSAQQTDIDDDDMDLICYPSERFLRNTALATESGSKLRWRIIIKRGEEK